MCQHRTAAGVRVDLSATSYAVGRESPMCDTSSDRSACSARDCAQVPPVPPSASATMRLFCVHRTDVYSPAPSENAPATRPAEPGQHDDWMGHRRAGTRDQRDVSKSRPSHRNVAGPPQPSRPTGQRAYGRFPGCRSSPYPPHHEGKAQREVTLGVRTAFGRDGCLSRSVSTGPAGTQARSVRCSPWYRLPSQVDVRAPSPARLGRRMW